MSNSKTCTYQSDWVTMNSPGMYLAESLVGAVGSCRSRSPKNTFGDLARVPTITLSY